MMKLLLAVVMCFSAVHAWADSEVFVEKAGTLSTLLPSSDSKLKVTGSINGTDVKYLRELVLDGNVRSLDLSEVKIVKGGVAYYESFKTENDVIGESMFQNCSKLRAIVLPTTLTAINAMAFASTGLQEIDIPNSVSHLGKDAFAYCTSLDKVVIGSRVSKLDQGVFYQSAVTKAFVKPMTPPATSAYLFSSNSLTIRVYSDARADYLGSGWAEYGTIMGRLENYYPKEEAPTDVVKNLCSTFFEDAACTTLKAEYQAMGDEALTAAMTEAGMPTFMTEIAVKIKNETWATYEKDFRIHTYNAFSDANYWNKKLNSTGGSYMGNPTGIYCADLNPLYVFVDEDVPEDATLYIAGCSGNGLISSAKAGTKLSKGLNIVDGVKDALYYIVYTADTQSQTKTLSEWPGIKIHIEGGTVNGYYDVARHSDADYKALLRGATHDLFTIKSDHALFNFKTSTYKTVWPKTIDKSINWFDSLAVWQSDLMGYTVAVASGQRAGAPYFLTGGEALFPTYYNNPYFAIQGSSSDAGYANSSPYRTCYNSVECIQKSFDVSNYDLDDWCSSHECGHNNQGTINLEGGTESSNNLFSNYIRYLDGLVTSVGSPLSAVMEEYADHTPFFVRNVNSQLRMYWQLYLYYHLAQHNTSFYPSLFKALREDPLDVWGNSNNSSLKFVRKVCEVAQEDLSDYFRAWGFFETFNNMAIDDYGNHTMTVRQSDINKTLAEISKYPKNRQILFVEDRADYVLTTDFLTTAGQKRRDSYKVGEYGDLGQFTDYLTENAKPASYAYLQADSLYAMEGTGGVGFLMLNENDKLVYAANALDFYIPTRAGGQFTIYSIDANGTLREVPKAGEGIETVHLDKAGTLPDNLSAHIIKAIISGPMNGTDIKYLRQLISDYHLQSLDLLDARIVSGGAAYYENYTTSSSTIGNSAFRGFKQLIAIRLPLKLTKIDATAFANSGLKEVEIPDRVTTIGSDAFSYCEQLTRVVIGSKVKTLEQGVFYSSPVKNVYVKPLTPPTTGAYLFNSKPVIHVYASALNDYIASSWAEYGTIVGDLEDEEDITPVEDLQATPQQTPDMAPVYDLYGRRVIQLKPSTIYIQKGKKIITAP